MLDTSKRTIATLTAAACLGAGGWAVAASTSGSGSSNTTTTPTQQTQQAPAQGTYGAPPAAPGGQTGQPPAGGPGQSFPGEKLLTGSDAQKATAAATAKLPGATIERVETDANDGAVYEAHVTKSDGSRATVLMDGNFSVTSVLDH